MTNFEGNQGYEDKKSDRQQQYITLIEQLDLTIRARIPLLYIVAVEEEPVEEVLRQVALRSQRQSVLGYCTRLERQRGG